MVGHRTYGRIILKDRFRMMHMHINGKPHTNRYPSTIHQYVSLKRLKKIDIYKFVFTIIEYFDSNKCLNIIRSYDYLVFNLVSIECLYIYYSTSLYITAVAKACLYKGKYFIWVSVILGFLGVLDFHHL